MNLFLTGPLDCPIAEVVIRIAPSSGPLHPAFPHHFQRQPGAIHQRHAEVADEPEHFWVFGGAKGSTGFDRDLMTALGAVGRRLRPRGFREVMIILSSRADMAPVVQGLRMGLYSFDSYRRRKLPNVPARVYLVLPEEPQEEDSALLEKLTITEDSVEWVRELGNVPPNDLRPNDFIKRLESEFKDLPVSLKIHDKAALEAMGLRGILAVGSGSTQPPALVELEWSPGIEMIENPMHFVLVGKTVTFDSGGLSLKKADGMEEERYDKMGGLTAAGVLRAAALLRVPFRLTALLPVVENLPSGSAYRPGDIIRMVNGDTVEVVNTDAEGRIILADTLAWAAAQKKPDLMLDVATLTSACMVALGLERAGVFSDDETFAADLRQAGLKVGEAFWSLPVGGEFLENMRGTQADFRNGAKRWGGASDAASFLRHFAGDIPWAHLDIAGVSFLMDSKPWAEFGASGFGVRTILEFFQQKMD
jgi:leucyl aminopeptidase